jgi:sarcosine oxidase
MRVIIIGSGIVGLSSAWALVKRGHSVTVLEQASAIPNPLSASGDHHRMIRRAYGAADHYARMMTEAFEQWDAMWRDLGRSHYIACGVLGMSQKPGDQAEVLRRGLDRLDHPYRLLSPREAAERYPFLDRAALRYAFLSADGGVLLSRRIAVDLAGWLRSRGVAVRANARVVDVDADAGRVTLDGGEAMSADFLVVSPGAWVLRLFPALAAMLTTFRTYVAYLHPPSDLRPAWRDAPAIVDIGGDVDGYVLPPVEGLGLKVGSGLHKRLIHDPHLWRSPEPGEGEHLRDLFSPPFARIDRYRVNKVASCVYTFTKDHRFFARRVGRAIVVSACSGHGYKFGAAIGARIAVAVDRGDACALARWLRGEMSGLEQAGVD